jgi:hypothetical protein
LSAQESFDPKPFAPLEYRGELKAIPEYCRESGKSPSGF